MKQTREGDSAAEERRLVDVTSVTGRELELLFTLRTFLSFFTQLLHLTYTFELLVDHTTAPSALCFRYASIPVYLVPLLAPWQCNLGAALLWPLQLYWFRLICRGALRQFIAGRSNTTFKADHDGCTTPSNGCSSRQEDGRRDGR